MAKEEGLGIPGMSLGESCRASGQGGVWVDTLVSTPSVRWASEELCLPLLGAVGDSLEGKVLISLCFLVLFLAGPSAAGVGGSLLSQPCLL